MIHDNNLSRYIINLEQTNSRLTAIAVEAVNRAQALYLENMSLRYQLAEPAALQPVDEAMYRDTAQLAAWGAGGNANRSSS